MAMKGVWGWLAPEPMVEPSARLAGLDPNPSGMGASEAQIQTTGSLGSSSWQDGQAYAVNGLLVAFAGRPEPQEGPRGGGRGFAEWLAATYRQAPDKTLPPRLLTGPFVLAVLDPGNQEGLLAVDRMGIWDLAYAASGDSLVFSPRSDRVAEDPGVRASLDPQGIFSYLYHHTVPHPDTVFHGVQRLGPGQMVEYRDGRATARAYWEPTYTENHREPVEQLQARFRSTLRSAIEREAGDGPVGAFLSGGTDSSTVTGMLGEVTGEPPRTFAIGFDEPGYDETEFARLTARHFNARHREYFVTPEDVAAAIPTIAAGYDQPYGNASVVPSYYCARLAREDGIQALLGGDGGDELFAGNARYAKQWLFSLYHRVPPWARRVLLEPATGLPGSDHFPPLRKMRRYIEQASQPLPERWESYNLLEFVGLDRVLTPDFLAEVDPGRPLAEMRREFARYRDNALVNQLMGVDLKYALADDDLRKVTGAGELAGVETRFPFLREEVVTLASEVPPELKMKRTRLRHFFKEALRDYLPPETLAKTKHGFGLPFGVWLRQEGELRDLAFDSLSGLSQRGIIRRGWIDELIGERMDEHAAFFGTLVWVLMMLEQWFRSR
jgi:asparagine synthase (glutamine-hydrolysing)